MKTPSDSSKPIQPLYALITGANSGLGLEFAHKLASAHIQLVLVVRAKKSIEKELASLTEESGYTPLVIEQDLAQSDAAAHIVAALQEHNIAIDILINNAGFGLCAPFVFSDDAKQNALETVNIKTLQKLTKALLPHMVKRRRGALLNVASIAGYITGPYMATYYASKAYVLSFTQALHAELKSYGIHVTALCPGPVRTQFWKTAQAGDTLFTRIATSPNHVVHAALLALKRNKATCIPGLGAKLTVFATRILPRMWIAKIAAKIQKPQ